MPSAQRGPFATDVDKYYAITLGENTGFKARAALWLTNPDFQAVASFRFGQAARAYYARSKLLGLLPLIVSIVWRRRMANVHHVFISRGARIGPGFFITHRNGLFIGPVTIGENCVLHQNVTMGDRVAGGDHGTPTLGDNVWVGPGAMIFGNVTIGNNVTISAGTVVTKDIPGGALVAGNPGRVIQLEYDNSLLINFTMPKTQNRPDGATIAMTDSGSSVAPTEVSHGEPSGLE